MRRRLKQAEVDTRTVPPRYDQEIADWLGGSLVSWTEAGVTVLIEAGEILAKPGWLLVLWPDGGRTVASAASAARVYEPVK